MPMITGWFSTSSGGGGARRGANAKVTRPVPHARSRSDWPGKGVM